MKIVLLVLIVGITAPAVLAVRTVNDARRDQPAQPAAESSGAAEPAAVVPAATLVERGPTPITRPVAEGPKTSSTAGRAPAGGMFGVGDRLKLAFYERVDVEEDKWRRMPSALRSIVQRPELSGEYTVQEDGKIFLPLLGSIPVANRSAPQVQAELAQAFEQMLGRKGLVNILSLERQPIYVLGPVKNPGSFRYSPGMTILHAIALAGGLDRGASEPWQKVEAVRETEKRSGAFDAMLKLLARAEVLKAERDGTEPKIPLQLLQLVGATEAANLVNQQRDRRKAVASARKNRERAALSALESAKQDVAAYKRMDALDDLVKLRQDRVNSMHKLVDRNVLGMPVLNQVQSELTEAELRRRDAINQYAMAKQRLASLEAEALKVQADLSSDLEVEIETIERQVADNEREFNTSENILGTLPAIRAHLGKDARVTYQVVRQTTAGPVSIEAAGMTVLQPGDLVNIMVSESDPKESGELVPNSGVSEKLSAGEANPGKQAADTRATAALPSSDEHVVGPDLGSDVR